MVRTPGFQPGNRGSTPRRVTNKQNMKILGIETSCDDTCLSLISLIDREIPSFHIESHLISSQDSVHKEWGGVYPILAQREHQKNLLPLFMQLLKKSNLLEEGVFEIDEREIGNILSREEIITPMLVLFLKKYKKPAIDYISLTIGPGLSPSLWVGVNFARAISFAWDIPIIPVNHIEAHLIISLFSIKKDICSMIASDFPAIGLVVSGGHTQLSLIRKIGQYEIIGETRDDAAGECFDKTARILGLDYPGGPAIAKQAEQWKDSERIISEPLPRPMINQKNLDFSFSGLKTAVLYRNRLKQKKNDLNYVKSEAREIQQAIIDVLIHKTFLAIKEHQAKSIIIGGGVSANKELRYQFEEKKGGGITLFFPPKNTSTDNALMIAVTGYFNRQNACKYDMIKANPNLRI